MREPGLSDHISVLAPAVAPGSLLWRMLSEQGFPTPSLCDSPHPLGPPNIVEQHVRTAPQKDTKISQATKAARSFLGIF